MAISNSLRASNDEIYENSTTVNSLNEIKNFLASKNVKKAIIEKMAVSFMAKIPTETLIRLVDNTLYVGESVMKLGENIYMSAEKTKALIEQTHDRAMRIVPPKLPAVPPKRALVAANDEHFQKAA